MRRKEGGNPIGPARAEESRRNRESGQGCFPTQIAKAQSGLGQNLNWAPKAQLYTERKEESESSNSLTTEGTWNTSIRDS